MDLLKQITLQYSKEVITAAINQKVFTAEQARAILTAKGVEAAEIEETITRAGLTATTTSSTVALDLNTMSKVGNMAATTAQISEDTKSLLLKGKLITEEQIQTGATVELTKTKIADAVATGTLTKAEGEQLVATFGLTGATGGLGAAFTGLGVQIKATTAAMWTFLTTNPIGWVVALTGAIAGTIAIYEALTTSVKEAKKSLDDSIGTITAINNEVQTLESELETAKDKVSELQEQINNGANSSTYETELGLLRDQTEELERQLAIKKEEQRLAAKDAADDADKNYNAEYFSKYDSSGQLIAGTSVKANDPVQELNNTIQALKKFQDEYKKTEDELAKNSAAALFNSVAHPDLGIKAHPEMAKLNEKAAESNRKELERLDKQMNEASAHALEFYNLLNLQKQALDGLTEAGYILTDEEKYRYAYVNSMMQAYQNYLNTVNDVKKVSTAAGSIQNAKTSMGYAESDNEPQTFSQLIDSAQTFQESINSAGEALNKLTSGEYTASDLLTYIGNINSAMDKMGKEVDWESISSIDELKDKIQELADSYVDTFLAKNDIDADSDFAEMLRGIVNEAMSASNRIDSLNSSIDSLQSAYSSLTSIVDEYNSTGTLTLDNLQTLLSLEPEYLNCLISENGQLALNSDALSILLNQRLNDAKAQAVQNAITQINTLAEEANATAKENNGTAAENAKIKIDDYNLSLSDTVKKAFLSAGAVSTLNAALDGASDAGVSEEAIQNVMDTFEAQLAIIDQIGASSVGSALGSNAKKSGKKSADEYLEAFKKELDKLDSLKERGKITELDYLQQLRVLYIKYFADKKKYLDEYEEYEHKYLSGLKSYYESVFSYISKLLGKKISALGDEKDAAVDSLKAQQKAAEENLKAQQKAIQAQIDSIQAQIDAKNKEIDAINEAADAVDRQKKLEEALFNQKRAQEQKVDKVYAGKDKGFIYKVDETAIRDATEDVEDAKRDIRIAAIEKEIDLLDESIDRLEAQKDAIDDMIEASNAQFEAMIEQTQAYYDQLIESMQKYQDRWDELSELQEQADMRAALEEMGYTEEQILNMSEEAFQNLKMTYLSFLKEMNSGNDEIKNHLSELSNVNLDEMNGHLTETNDLFSELSGVDLTTAVNSMGNIETGLKSVSEMAQEAISALTGGGSGNGEQKEKGQKQEGNGESGNASSLEGAIQQQGEVANEVFPAEIEQVNALTEATDGTVESVNSIADALEKLHGTVIDTYVVNHKIEVDGTERPPIDVPGFKYGGKAEFAGTEGNSYASGSHGLKNREKDAIVAEFAPETVIYPNGTYKVFTEPTMTDLPKNTSVFNSEQTEALLATRSKSLQLGNNSIFDGYSPEVISNMQNMAIAENARSLPDFTGNVSFPESVANESLNITFNGGINLQNVQDTDGFARAILTNLKTSVRQQMNMKKYRR